METLSFGLSYTAGTDDFMMFYVESGKMKIQFKDSGAVSGPSTEYGYGNQTITAGVWVCLAWVSDGTIWTTYVNGVADTSWTSQYGSPVGKANSGRWLGDVQGGDNISVCALVRSSVYAAKMQGQVSQVGVWGGSSGTTGVLTATQILAIHDLGPGADLTTSYATGMVGYWTFGNKTTQGDDYVTHATTIYDQSAGSDDNLTGVSLAAPYAGHTVTATNGAYHSAARSVVGGSSMFFDGTDDHLNCGSVPDCNFGTADFTIDFWTKYNLATSGNGIANWAGGSWQLTHGGGNELYMQNSGGSPNFSDTITGTCAAGVWRHVAVQRKDGFFVCCFWAACPFLLQSRRKELSGY